MKKIKLFIISLIALFGLPNIVNAASASISVTGSNTAVVGNRVTLSVVLSSGTPIGSWEMMLNYDSNYLQFVGGGGEEGGMNMVNSSSGTKSKKYTFTFKALKSGNTTVKVGSYIVYSFGDMSEMSVSNSGKSLKIITQAELEASYSKDNNLKSIGVEGYELTETFEKDKLEYTVEVPEGTTSVNIIAVKNDGTATVSGDGLKEVNPGTNTFEIVVKAQNGVEKTYKLNVIVVDKNPIEITLNKEKYTLIKYESGFECPTDYEKSTIKINDIDVPSCYNKTIKYTLVGVKNAKGDVKLAKYSQKKYELYSEITSDSLIVIPLNINKNLKHFNKYTIKINGQEVEVLKYKEKSNTSIIYGLNLSDGKKGYYVYDEKHKTLVEYDNEYIDYLETNNKYMFIACISFAAGLFISFVSLICVSKKKKKKNNSIKENKTNIEEKPVKEEEKKKEKIENKKEEINTEEVYNIFEDEKKSKKKNKVK